MAEELLSSWGMIRPEGVEQNTRNIYRVPKITDKLQTLDVVDKESYNELHSQPLVPLDIVVDCALFREEIKQFDNFVKRWGPLFDDQPKFGLPLVNLHGDLSQQIQPADGSITLWNRQHPDDLYIETDFRTPTAVLQIQSLHELHSTFDTHWCRSNILKWDTGAEFHPHVDNVVPAYWFRLWGTDSPDTIDLCFLNTETNEFERQEIEAGRIYLIDTSLVHIAKSRSDDTNQWFLAVMPSAADTIRKLKCQANVKLSKEI